MHKLDEFKTHLVLSGRRSNVYPRVIKYVLTAVGEPTTENIRLYISDLILKHKPEYINLQLKAIKAYADFTGKHVTLPKFFKPERKIKESISLEFLENEIIPNLDKTFENALKIQAILYFMFYSGVRKSEVYLLKRKDFDLNNGQVKVFLQKVGKEKIMLFPVKVTAILKDYFSTSNEKENAFNLGVGGIDYIFNELKKKYPDKHLHPHIFKASAITHLHDCGFSISEISSLVGISANTIENHYLDVRLEKIKQSYEGRIK